MSETVLDAIHREMRNKKLLKDNSDSEKELVSTSHHEIVNSFDFDLIKNDENNYTCSRLGQFNESNANKADKCLQKDVWLQVN